MYYRIKDNIIFRMYRDFGYITDNSKYGYTIKNNNDDPGEKYLSSTASIMVSMLKTEPRHIDDVINDLKEIYYDVEYDTIKKDTIELFNSLVNLGFLYIGDDIHSCNKYKTNNKCYDIDSLAGINLEYKYLLKSIHIDVVNFCNEKCIHCFFPHSKINKYINTKLFYKIIEEGRSLNAINITLSGGEPLLHPEIINFLKKCRELNFSVNILSNLTLLSKELIREISKNNLISIQTSIYSMNPDIHDKITNNKGSFTKTFNNLLDLYSVGIPIQISCPIIKQNKDNFKEVLEWCKCKDIQLAVEPLIFGSSDNKCSNLIHRLSLNEIEYIMDERILAGHANIIYEIAKEKESVCGNEPVCSVGQYKICVSSDGMVFPCVGWSKYIVGDLNVQTIEEIWNYSEKLNELRKINLDRFEKCVRCKNRGYCTLCLMNNFNENNKDMFYIDTFKCRVADMIHKKINCFFNK